MLQYSTIMASHHLCFPGRTAGPSALHTDVRHVLQSEFVLPGHVYGWKSLRSTLSLIILEVENGGIVQRQWSCWRYTCFCPVFTFTRKLGGGSYQPSWKMCASQKCVSFPQVLIPQNTNWTSALGKGIRSCPPQKKPAKSAKCARNTVNNTAVTNN